MCFRGEVQKSKFYEELFSSSIFLCDVYFIFYKITGAYVTRNLPATILMFLLRLSFRLYLVCSFHRVEFSW